MERTAILYVTERCNQACVFCLEEDGGARRPDVPAERVCTDLATLRESGVEHVTFMGGETFLRKDLPELLAETRRLGFTRVGVATNGTVLAKEGFLERMIGAGLEFVEMSLHADDAALAEAISGKPFTWELQRRALAALEAARDRLHVIVNVVVCRENHARLEAVVRTLLEGFPRLAPVVKLKFVSVVGAAASSEGAPLTYAEVDLGPVVALLRGRGAAFWLYNVPLCRVPGGADGVARSHEAQALVLDWRYHDYDHAGSGGYYDSGYQLDGNVWPAPCARCTFAPLCPGVEDRYFQRRGAAELSARREDPLPAVRTILQEAGRDPATARERLEELARRSRPGVPSETLCPRPGEAAIFLGHAAWPEPVAFDLGPADGRPAFRSTRRLALGYRPTPRELGGEESGRQLLKALGAALERAEGAGDTVGKAARRLAAAASRVPGWSCVGLRAAPDAVPGELEARPARGRVPGPAIPGT